MTKFVIFLSILLLVAAPTPASADTSEQNTIESACLLLLASDYLEAGMPLLFEYPDQHALCGVAWFVSWLPDSVQALFWRDRYPCALHARRYALGVTLLRRSFSSRGLEDRIG